MNHERTSVESAAFPFAAPSPSPPQQPHSRFRFYWSSEVKRKAECCVLNMTQPRFRENIEQGVESSRGTLSVSKTESPLASYFRSLETASNFHHGFFCVCGVVVFRKTNCYHNHGLIIELFWGGLSIGQSVIAVDTQSPTQQARQNETRWALWI